MKKLLLLFIPLCFVFVCMDASNKRKTEKITKYRYSISFVYSPVNSVFEDENIILQINRGVLWAKNKTDKTIFIDLSQCFAINNGRSYPLYENALDEGYASKAKISDTNDEYLSIAPAIGSNQNVTAIGVLSNRIYGEYNTTEVKSGEFTDYNKRFLNVVNGILNESLQADQKGKHYIGTVTRHLTEDESISNIGASIAYAFNKKAEEWTSVTISTWVSDIVFAPYYTELPKEISKKDKQGFGVKESDPVKIHVRGDFPFEFEDDISPIIIADWAGNFKKGTFTLKPIIKKTGGMDSGRALSGILAGVGAKPFVESIINYDGSSSDWGRMFYYDYGYTSQIGN